MPTACNDGGSNSLGKEGAINSLDNYLRSDYKNSDPLDTNKKSDQK